MVPVLAGRSNRALLRPAQYAPLAGLRKSNTCRLDEFVRSSVIVYVSVDLSAMSNVRNSRSAPMDQLQGCGSFGYIVPDDASYSTRPGSVAPAVYCCAPTQ